MPSQPTAPGELPRFVELDPLRFQGLCRDLYQLEGEFATAEVFGTPGQLQRGVDVVATAVLFGTPPALRATRAAPLVLAGRNRGRDRCWRSRV
jgi:hypothetical protein